MAEDIIQIAGLEISAVVGILEAERVKEQKILLDLEIYTDIRPAARSRMIEHTVDYSFLAEVARLLANIGPLVRRATLDSSPEVAYDWCLHGHITSTEASCSHRSASGGVACPEASSVRAAEMVA